MRLFLFNAVLLFVAALVGDAARADVVNGTFDAVTGSQADSWTHWTFDTDPTVSTNAFSVAEIATWGSPGGTSHASVGARNDGSAGVYQFTGGTGGVDYLLTVDSGADAFWLPTGTMAMEFYDNADVLLGSAIRNTVDPAVYGGQFDIPHPWETYTLQATAPVGTTQIKVEFATNFPATGSIGFDNASIVEVAAVPEPTALGLLALGACSMVLHRRKRG